VSTCYVAKRKPLHWSRQKLEFAPDAQLLIYLGAKSLDLSFQVDDFKRKCTNWEKYDAELNALNVNHTRRLVSHPSHGRSSKADDLLSYDLPDDVFTDGEIRPLRPQKKKVLNGATKKRSAAEVCEVLYPQIRKAVSILNQRLARVAIKPLILKIVTVLTVIGFIGIHSRQKTADLGRVKSSTNFCAESPQSSFPSPIDQHLTAGLLEFFATLI
jgi:hypothetical protein